MGMQKIKSELLNTAVSGLNLKAGTLKDQLDGQVTLLVFLRHFG